LLWLSKLVREVGFLLLFRLLSVSSDVFGTFKLDLRHWDLSLTGGWASKTI